MPLIYTQSPNAFRAGSGHRSLRSSSRFICRTVLLLQSALCPNWCTLEKPLTLDLVHTRPAHLQPALAALVDEGQVLTAACLAAPDNQR